MPESLLIRLHPYPCRKSRRRNWRIFAVSASAIILDFTAQRPALEVNSNKQGSRIMRVRTFVFFLQFFAAVLAIQSSGAQSSSQASLPNETPATLTPATDSFDYVKRDVMIPMR